jgi:hypothetical protein
MALSEPTRHLPMTAGQVLSGGLFGPILAQPEEAAAEFPEFNFGIEGAPRALCSMPDTRRWICDRF